MTFSTTAWRECANLNPVYKWRFCSEEKRRFFPQIEAWSGIYIFFNYSISSERCKCTLKKKATRFDQRVIGKSSRLSHYQPTTSKHLLRRVRSQQGQYNHGRDGLFSIMRDNSNNRLPASRERLCLKLSWSNKTGVRVKEAAPVQRKFRCGRSWAGGRRRNDRSLRGRGRVMPCWVSSACLPSPDSGRRYAHFPARWDCHGLEIGHTLHTRAALAAAQAQGDPFPTSVPRCLTAFARSASGGSRRRAREVRHLSRRFPAREAGRSRGWRRLPAERAAPQQLSAGGGGRMGRGSSRGRAATSPRWGRSPPPSPPASGDSWSVQGVYARQGSSVSPQQQLLVRLGPQPDVFSFVGSAYGGAALSTCRAFEDARSRQNSERKSGPEFEIW